MRFVNGLNSLSASLRIRSWLSGLITELTQPAALKKQAVDVSGVMCGQVETFGFLHLDFEVNAARANLAP